MTDECHLAICCGPIVTTWNCSSDAKGDTNTTSFAPRSDNTPVVDVSWNSSGQVLASCLSVENGETDNVFFSSTSQNAKLLDSFRHDAGLKRPTTNTPKPGVDAKATCISFGVKSRYLVVGDDCGTVCLWDIKKRSRVRHYFHPNENHASLQATLDPTDSNVLSLSEKAFYIFRLREATLAASISETTTSRLTRYSTSSLEPRHVAIGTRIGSLNVYDMALQSQVLSMSLHTGSITGVQYSAVNKLLLASASTDATLCFADIATGNMVQSMSLESPATSMSFHKNGYTCAVGTDSGKVLVYDLRNPSEMVASYQGDGNVLAVQFAPNTASKPRHSTSSTTSNATELNHVVDSVLNRSTKENKPSSFKSTPSLNENAVKEIVRQELDVIRDEMHETMRILQVDMCRKFLQQTQEYNEVLSKLRQENSELREENEFLRNS